ncbi:MAG: Addiction module toxin, HicA family [Nitrospira sp.]|nr:MAG: Addiction module toxin, HicA family [Nitrospira sp.]
MSKLPVISGHDAVRALKQIGYLVDHQTGSHLILRQVHPPHRRLTIPTHAELARGTLRSIIRQAGLTVDEFRSLL